jgi:hypothetical protein
MDIPRPGHDLRNLPRDALNARIAGPVSGSSISLAAFPPQLDRSARNDRLPELTERFDPEGNANAKAGCSTVVAAERDTDVQDASELGASRLSRATGSGSAPAPIGTSRS